jgi:hypothetical protein
MAAVLITGGSGAGKTAVAAELARRGRLSIDADADEYLARFADRAGRVVCCPAAPDLGWLAENWWEWDPVRLEEILAAGHAGRTLYVCGYASNETGFFDRFDLVILLEIDEPTMLRRLDEPSRDNDWGRVGDTRALERSWLPGYQARMRRTCGVAVVDATAPLESVIETILSRTEPAVPHRR